jgi:hypothetical protein
MRRVILGSIVIGPQDPNSVLSDDVVGSPVSRYIDERQSSQRWCVLSNTGSA